MSRPLPPGLARPTDEQLEALGIRWVDLAAVTPSGLPYPASSDPVANGAANIQDLALAVDTRGPRLGWVGTVGAVTLPSTGGTLGIASGLNVPAVTYPRLIHLQLEVTFSAVASWGQLILFTQPGNASVKTMRFGVTHTPIIVNYWEVVPAGVARTYNANVNSGGAASSYASNTGLSSFWAHDLGATATG